MSLGLKIAILGAFMVGVWIASWAGAIDKIVAETSTGLMSGAVIGMLLRDRTS